MDKQIDGELTFNDDDSEASTIKVIPLKESENYNISSIESADNNADDQAQSSLDSPISTGGEGRSLRISIGDWPAIFESLEAEAAREALQQEEPTPTEALVTTPFLSNLDARMPPSFEHNPEDSKNWESTRDNSLDTTSPATSMVIVRQHTLDSTCTSNTIRSSIDFFSGGIDYLDNDEQEESEEQQTGSTSHNSGKSLHSSEVHKYPFQFSDCASNPRSRLCHVATQSVLSHCLTSDGT